MIGSPSVVLLPRKLNVGGGEGSLAVSGQRVACLPVDRCEPHVPPQ